MSATDLTTTEVLTIEETATFLRISRNAAYAAARQWRATKHDQQPRSPSRQVPDPVDHRVPRRRTQPGQRRRDPAPPLPDRRTRTNRPRDITACHRPNVEDSSGPRRTVRAGGSKVFGLIAIGIGMLIAAAQVVNPRFGWRANRWSPPPHQALGR